MATAEFDAALAADCCEATIKQQETKMAEANELAIAEMAKTPYGGCWPFSKSRLRSREECEENYGKSHQFRTCRWWTERPYRGRIARINAILKLAKSENQGLLRLDENEARIVGVALKDSTN